MSKISDIEIYNRPREKALKNGINSLTNKELLAIIIRCGIKDTSALDIAANILEKYKSLIDLFNADMHDLMKIKGIKKAKSIEISAILELAKRAIIEKNAGKISIKNSQDIYELLKFELENQSQECFVAIYLNIKLSIIKKQTLFIGGETSSLVDINLLFKNAIACGARKIICVHNHPSGDPTPSSEDINITNKIRDISKILKIELLDHIIIGKNGYFSFEKMRL